jgi:hypothetical protein
MAVPATMKMLSARKMQYRVWLITDPDTSTGQLVLDAAGRRLSYFHLRQAARRFATSNYGSPSVEQLMYMMVPIWSWPKLAFLNFVARRDARLGM